MLTDNELTEAKQKLAIGRLLATEKMPYFSTALMAMSPHPREGLGTFAVDARWRMYYDPAKCIEWTVQEICTAWLHEVGHLVRSHSQRFQELEGHDHDQRLFNAAADAAINSDLRDEGLLLPNPELRYYAESNAEFPQWKRGMTAEEMYFIGKSRGKGKKEDENNDSKNNGDSPDGENKEDSNSPDGENPDNDKEDEMAGWHHRLDGREFA